MSGFNQHLQAIVIGNSADEFIRHATDLLREYEVKFVQCRDIYSAVGRLAEQTRGHTIVIGRIEQLSGEQGRILRKVNENGFTCCCFVERNLDRKHIRTLVETKPIIISSTEELEEVVTKLLAGDSVSSPGKKESKGSEPFIKDEFFTTEAELNALLGVGAPFCDSAQSGDQFR